VAIRKYGVATPLLPNVFGALLLGDLKGYVNARGSIFLHPGQNMAVEVEHNPDAGVSQPFAGDLWVYTRQPACASHDRGLNHGTEHRSHRNIARRSVLNGRWQHCACVALQSI